MTIIQEMNDPTLPSYDNFTNLEITDTMNDNFFLGKLNEAINSFKEKNEILKGLSQFISNSLKELSQDKKSIDNVKQEIKEKQQTYQSTINKRIQEEKTKSKVITVSVNDAKYSNFAFQCLEKFEEFLDKKSKK
jgi:hypothetical protein